MDSRYPYRHWLLTLLIGPCLLALFSFLSDGINDVLSFFEALPYVILFEIVASFPVLLLYVLLFNIVPYKKISLPVLKWIFNVFIIGCILLVYQILGGIYFSWYTISYPVAVIISSLFLKIKAKDEVAVVENHLPDNAGNSSL